MPWLLGFFGALIGAGLGEDENLLGAVTGFFCLYLLASVHRLRRELAALTLERSRERAAHLRSDAASQIAATPPSVPTPTPPSVPTPTPTPTPIPIPVLEPEPEPSIPAPPGWVETWLGKTKAWFTEGNVPVKIGVLVTLFGVAAALRLAVSKGYFNLPIEIRLSLIAAAALLALGWGWRERLSRPAFGLSLQGGAIGVMLLTVFAAFRLYGLLPPMLALALVVLLVAGSAALAVLQDTMALAVLGFLGGYLAPVLISTGSANHVALFTYYALLNAAVFGISWRRSWRLLNIMGFAFTFGVGAAWGREYYRPETFASVEPFLLLFFLSYIGIGLAYVLRQTEHRRPWVDGTLVFGTPLVAFPLQAAMLKDDRMGLAFSALFVALVYAGLVWWLRKRRGERLLTEAYGALALGFATLAIPLAFSASTSASVWALEGAGVAWMGIRQGRKFPWLSGLALQLLAAGAYLASLDHAPPDALGPRLLLLNAQWLGAAMLAFSGFALSLIHDRHRPVRNLAAVLMCWGLMWWFVGGVAELDRAAPGLGEWRFAMLYLSASIAVAALLQPRLQWPRLRWLAALASLLAIPLALAAKREFGTVFNTTTLPCWIGYLAAAWLALRQSESTPSRSLAVVHLSVLWALALAATVEAMQLANRADLAQGWRFVAATAPLSLVSAGLMARPGYFAWPRAAAFPHYQAGWFGPALVLLALAFMIGLFLEGRSDPLPYVPLANPLELALVALLLLGHALGAGRQAVRRLWPVLGFALLTLGTLRGVHHLHGEPWSESILHSGVTQASLTVAWSLMGVGAWILGSRRMERRTWSAGAALMVVVLAKLIFVDRGYMGNMPGIVSFMAVGLLLVVVGYIAPSPPKSPPSGAVP